MPLGEKVGRLQVEVEQAPLRDRDVPSVLRCSQCSAILEAVLGTPNFAIYKCPVCKTPGPKGTPIPLYVKFKPKGEIEV